MSYIDLTYKPGKTDVICQYYMEPAEGESVNKTCEAIAGESSIGTWTDISTMKPEIAERLKPSVFQIDEIPDNAVQGKGASRIKIAYPMDLFEAGNMPEILSSIAGNIFGMKCLDNLRLEDIEFPEDIVRSFKGPKFGIKGIRRLLQVKERPLVGTIVKPKVGLSADEHAKVAYESWIGGCDIVKDDENLTNQVFNRFDDRIVKTLRMRDKAEDETGERKIYMPNITAETNEMIRRAEFVKKYGCEYIMVDIVTVGFSALQTIRDQDFNLVIHAHRAMHGAITRNPRHGMSMLVLAQLTRLIGADQLHIGTVVGKMEGKEEEVTKIRDDITGELYGIESTFPVCSGGLHPGLFEDLIGIMGKDIIIQCGGGIHGHPDGTKAGATAARQAVDAAMKGTGLEEYAEDHEELKKALDKWGM